MIKTFGVRSRVDLSKDTFKTVVEYCGQVVSLLFPGLAVLDVVYHRGFFSKCPTNIYEFLLLIVWAVIVSIPFILLCEPAANLERVAMKLNAVREHDSPKEAYVLMPLLFGITVITCVIYWYVGYLSSTE